MSSSPIDIVKVFFGTFSLMGAEKAQHYLSDDFQLVNFSSVPIGRSAWVRFLAALKTALPDLKIRLTDVQESGDQVHFSETGIGTHRMPLDLSALDLPPVPAGGSLVTFPTARWAMTVSGAKISHAELISSLSNTGLPGLLDAFKPQPALTE